jgi:predicted PurR-regulated permease PerM
VPAAGYLAANGLWGRALVLALVGVLLISMVDNILRPILIGGRVPLNGLLVLISVLGGVSVFGMVGIVLGPVLVALGASVIEAQREVQAGK